MSSYNIALKKFNSIEFCDMFFSGREGDFHKNKTETQSYTKPITLTGLVLWEWQKSKKFIAFNQPKDLNPDVGLFHGLTVVSFCCISG